MPDLYFDPANINRLLAFLAQRLSAPDYAEVERMLTAAAKWWKADTENCLHH